MFAGAVKIRFCFEILWMWLYAVKQFLPTCTWRKPDLSAYLWSNEPASQKVVFTIGDYPRTMLITTTPEEIHRKFDGNLRTTQKNENDSKYSDMEASPNRPTAQCQSNKICWRCGYLFSLQNDCAEYFGFSRTRPSFGKIQMCHWLMAHSQRMRVCHLSRLFFKRETVLLENNW